MRKRVHHCYWQNDQALPLPLGCDATSEECGEAAVREQRLVLAGSFEGSNGHTPVLPQTVCHPENSSSGEPDGVASLRYFRRRENGLPDEVGVRAGSSILWPHGETELVRPCGCPESFEEHQRGCTQRSAGPNAESQTYRLPQTVVHDPESDTRPYTREELSEISGRLSTNNETDQLCGICVSQNY